MRIINYCKGLIRPLCDFVGPRNNIILYFSPTPHLLLRVYYNIFVLLYSILYIEKIINII